MEYSKSQGYYDQGFPAKNDHFDKWIKYLH